MSVLSEVRDTLSTLRAEVAELHAELTLPLRVAFGAHFDPERAERNKRLPELDQRIAALDGGKVVGSAGAFRFEMTTPGGAVAASGLTMVAVLPTQHPLARGKTVAIKDLAEYPLVLTQAGSQDMVMDMFERAGVRPKVAHELSQVISILEFVARGNGVSVLAAFSVPEQRAGLVFRPITPRTSRRVALACLDSARLSPAAHAFWELARREPPVTG